MRDSPAGTNAASTEADWRAEVKKALRGRPFETVRAVIEPGVAVDPLLPAGMLPPVWSRAGKPWTRLQRVDRPDPDGDSLAEALACGAEGFDIVLAGSGAAYGGGLDRAALSALLRHLPLDRGHLRLSPGPDAASAARLLSRAATDARLDPALLDIAFGLDPAEADEGEVRAAVELHGLGYRAAWFCADARAVHAAGATVALELGAALAGVVASLRLMLGAGLPDQAAVGGVDVALAADMDQFVTIAKFRAMRLLHARVLAAAGLARRPLHIHAETSFRMLTAEDVPSNLIRNTIAALAAGLGGADSLTVLPHGAATGVDDGEARRLALTAQAILIDEARLHRVADPGAGSGTIEQVTLTLAECAWIQFQQIEQRGGIGNVSAGAWLTDAVAEAAGARRAAIASGGRAIVGVTLFRPDGALGDPGPPSVGASGARQPVRDSAAFERSGA